MSRSRWIPPALVLSVLAVYGRTAWHPFIQYDDTLYVTGNDVIREGLTLRGIGWAVTTFHAANWHPLTWLSHMADVEFFGMRPGAHHLVSVMIHAASAVLLYLVLRRTTGRDRESGFVAALFALHPLHVESVAWVAERKDLLCGFFWILTMGAYARYVERPGAARYMATAACLGLALLAKPMAVTLPVVLLLMDWWPLGRFRRKGVETPPGRGRVKAILREKVPLLALSGASSVVTLVAQARGKGIVPLDLFDMDDRISNAAVSYVAYLWNAVWPASLAVFYPHPGSGLPLWKVGGAAVLLLAVTGIACAQARRRPYLLFGWAWYLVTLLPVAGVVQVGGQAMADRYTYIPLVGVFLAAAWAVSDWTRGAARRRKAIAGAAFLSLLLAGIASWRQAGYWRSGEALFIRTIEVTGENWMAEHGLGAEYLERGDPERAIAHLKEAVRIRPLYPEGHNALAAALEKAGRRSEAIDRYEEAIRLHPGYAAAHNNLGVVLARSGRIEDAAARFRAAVGHDPGYVEARKNLALTLERTGKPREAIGQYREALAMNPVDPEIHNNLGAALARDGNVGEAELHFQEAVRLRPDYGEARFNLGIALSGSGRFPEAVAHLREAVRLMPENGAAREQLRLALSGGGT